MLTTDPSDILTAVRLREEKPSERGPERQIRPSDEGREIRCRITSSTALTAEAPHRQPDQNRGRHEVRECDGRVNDAPRPK
jgi:hypothetical protein